MKRVIADKDYEAMFAKGKRGTYTKVEWTVFDAKQEPTGSNNFSKDNYIAIENGYVNLILYFDGEQLIECVSELEEL